MPPAQALPIFEQGQALFLERVIRSSAYSVREHLIQTLLTQIQIERDGYTVGRSAIKGCVEVLLELKERGSHGEFGPSVYDKDFAPVFLKETEAFYKAEASLLLDTCNAMQYLKKVCTYFVSQSATISEFADSRSMNDSRQKRLALSTTFLQRANHLSLRSWNNIFSSHTSRPSSTCNPPDWT